MNSEPTYNLLNSINYPEDLRKLTVEQLPEVCGELRQDIIKELCCNPGHFAASLGTVELTVALHYVYNTPYDRIVWDVGHQAYGHKILTGRREAFSTNRKLGGIRLSRLRKKANMILSRADTLPILFLPLLVWLSQPPGKETPNAM